jgi:hypothetical protein
MAKKKGVRATIKILFIAANPFEPVAFHSGSSAWLTHMPLGLDHEYREIQQKLRASEYRDDIHLVSRWAARPDDLLQALNEERPQIVHFSGHGSDVNELVLSDDAGRPKVVSKSAIESLFRTTKGYVRAVVLNACFSRGQAAAIVKSVDCAVGMKREIGDKAAIVFSASFYRAIGFGCSVKEAFEQGQTALELEGIPEASTPKLLCRVGVEPARLKLVGN